MRCSACGGEQSAADQPIDHRTGCRIGARRASLAERDDPLGVGGVVAASQGRVGGRPPRKQATKKRVSIPVPGRGDL